MKAPRFQSLSKSRRDFNVTSAGFFSVLKMTPRKIVLRPQAGYRSLIGSSTSLQAPEQLADRLSTMKIPLIGDTGMIDRGFVRMGLILFTAASFTLFILWWMMGLRS
jgi:hypothetical protein